MRVICTMCSPYACTVACVLVYTYSGRPSYTGSTHLVHGAPIVPVLLAFVAAASRV